MLRLFVALDIPHEIKQSIAVLQSGLQDARWISPESLHLTLRFIGDVEEGVAEDVNMALSAVRGPAVEVALAGLDCFESRGKVRAVWTRADGGEALSQLQGRIESALRRGAGLAPEGRKFTPHVTVARLKNVPARKVTPYLERNGGFRAGPFAMRHFTLFRSHLGHGGSHYEPLVEYVLDQ